MERIPLLSVDLIEELYELTEVDPGNAIKCLTTEAGRLELAGIYAVREILDSLKARLKQQEDEALDVRTKST